MMSEFLGLTLQETIAYVDGQERIPGSVVVDILHDNNNEFKILSQSRLVQDAPVPVLELKGVFPSEEEGGAVQTVNYDQFYANLVEFNEDFIRVESTADGTVATQTHAGRLLSAAAGGHLLGLSYDSSMSLRNLMGEKRKPRKISSRGNMKAQTVFPSHKIIYLGGCIHFFFFLMCAPVKKSNPMSESTIKNDKVLTVFFFFLFFFFLFRD